jgi:hypothetical protein
MAGEAKTMAVIAATINTFRRHAHPIADTPAVRSGNRQVGRRV